MGNPINGNGSNKGCQIQSEQLDKSGKTVQNVQMLLVLATFLGAQLSFRFPLLPLKSQYHPTFLQYLGKYAFIQRATRRFWKVLRQINPYVSNKWPLKLPCAYLNTQESRHTGTPLKWNKGG
ncbi:hypothetical protein Tsp_02848 [Trichinella spiralis]|uniref:hypothetical protein n=1 Tax=Trichinella spiralis TaxID=6334 RepID=UPI0001EFC97D|nr:hypothetical protein Tsp_02848 [Trichinella spiralis]